jgi:hypothetical protein
MQQRRATDQIKVVGFDPSLRNWGIAKGVLIPNDGSIIITHLDVIRPFISEAKGMRPNAKDVSAAEQLAVAAWNAMEGAQAVFIEVPHGSQSSRAMASYGVCVGVIGALATSGIPMYQVSEAEVKKATTANREAKKEDTIAWAMSNHPEAPWPMKTALGISSVVAGRAEHMADAIGAIYAGVASKPFKQVIALLTSNQRITP